MAEERFPAELTAEETARIQDQARKAFAALKLRGYARIDFRMSSDGTFYCLEANTLPGMTQHESHSTGGGRGGDLVPGAVRAHRATRARRARRFGARAESVVNRPSGPTAALAGVPAGLQAQGVWIGRRQLFVRFAAEAETATMYTADALAIGDQTRDVAIVVSFDLDHGT